MTTKENFLSILSEEVFSEFDEQIDFDTQFKELDCWDSITALSLIAVFDSDFNKPLSGDQISEYELISELFELIK